MSSVGDKPVSWRLSGPLPGEPNDSKTPRDPVPMTVTEALAKVSEQLTNPIKHNRIEMMKAQPFILVYDEFIKGMFTADGFRVYRHEFSGEIGAEEAQSFYALVDGAATRGVQCSRQVKRLQQETNLRRRSVQRQQLGLIVVQSS